jgi:hypothetical protein
MYTNWGLRRGCCGHIHDELADALSCLRDDVKTGRFFGIRADRSIRRVGGVSELVTCSAVRGPSSTFHTLPWTPATGEWAGTG